MNNGERISIVVGHMEFRIKISIYKALSNNLIQLNDYVFYNEQKLVL